MAARILSRRKWPLLLQSPAASSMCERGGERCASPRRLRILLSEELLAIGKAVRLEEEPKDHRAVRRYRLVLISARPPAELAGPAHALVVLKRALEHVGLLQRGVLVQRNDGAGR